MSNDRQSSETTRGANPDRNEFLAFRSVAANARFLTPHLQSGMRLLDCGCGPGTITVGLAEVVAPGEVVGIDLDEARIESAQKLATKNGVTNVSFQVADVLHLPFPDESFDTAFEHAMLEHLDDPVSASKEVMRVLKPGGVFGASDRIQTQGSIVSSPIAEAWFEHFEMRRAVGAEQRSDMNLGLRLHTILGKAGFVDVVPSVSLAMKVTTEERERSARSVITTIQGARFRETVLRLGVGDEATLDRHVRAFEEFAADPDAWAASPNGEALGWKPAH